MAAGAVPFICAWEEGWGEGKEAPLSCLPPEKWSPGEGCGPRRVDGCWHWWPDKARRGVGDSGDGRRESRYCALGLFLRMSKCSWRVSARTEVSKGPLRGGLRDALTWCAFAFPELVPSRCV